MALGSQAVGAAWKDRGAVHGAIRLRGSEGTRGGLRPTHLHGIHANHGLKVFPSSDARSCEDCASA